MASFPVQVFVAVGLLAYSTGCITGPETEGNATQEPVGEPSSSIPDSCYARSTREAAGKTVDADDLESEEVTQSSGGPAVPLHVELILCTPRSLFSEQGALIQLNVWKSSSRENGTAGVLLPDGVEVLAGNLTYDGALSGWPFSLTATVRADERSRYIFSGWAEIFEGENGGGRAAPNVLLGVEGHPLPISGFDPDPSAFELSVDLEANDSDPRLVVARVLSSISMDAAAYLRPDPYGIRIAEGNGSWFGKLEAGVPHQIAWRLEFPHDGQFPLWFVLYPHASLGGGSFADLVYFRVSGDFVEAG